MDFSNKYVLAIDQGTTSSRAILFNQKGDILSLAQKTFQQYFPQPGWVEHNPNEIWSSQSAVIAEAVEKAGITDEQIACIGIANQRETTIVWERKSGKPIYQAIVWQDRRTADYCEELKAKGLASMIREKTGLVIDAYFSATKIRWILDHVEGARERAERGELCFGTVDTWIVWNLTQGGTFVTDMTNASRTMLFNIHTQEWDRELLDLFQIPLSMMPEVKSCSEVYCQTSIFKSDIPVSGMAGDQQAALFGQLCTEEGMIKTTYGTGCFMVLNTGNKPVLSENNLLTTIAWKIGDQVTYALEGSVFVGGAVVQWLRDELGCVLRARWPHPRLGRRASPGWRHLRSTSDPIGLPAAFRRARKQPGPRKLCRRCLPRLRQHLHSPLSLPGSGFLRRIWRMSRSNTAPIAAIAQSRRRFCCVRFPGKWNRACQQC